MCLCVNAAYSCFVSPNVAKIHVSLWQPPLSKAGKITSWSCCFCIKTFRCSRTPPTALFSSTHWLFHFPHCYFFYLFFGYRGCQKDFSLFAYAGYSSECFHPLSWHTGSSSMNGSIALPDFRTLRKLTMHVSCS